jgi:hypothetical protein
MMPPILTIRVPLPLQSTLHRARPCTLQRAYTHLLYHHTHTRTHTHDQHEYYYCRRWFDYSFYTTQSFMCDGSFYTLHPCVTMVIVALCTRCCCCCCSGWVHALCRLSGAAQIQVEKLRDMWAVYTNMRTEQVCVTPM